MAFFLPIVGSSFLVLVGLCQLFPSCRDPQDFGLQKVNDQFLMDTFLSIDQLSKSDLLSINHCCLAKHVLIVDDICLGDGTTICHDTVLPQVAPFPSNLIWQKEQPSAKDWQIWSQTL